MKAAVIILILCGPSIVQSSVMNLNNDMPTRLEDATPLEKFTTDIQYSFVLEKKDQDQVRQRPNIRYGLSEDLQLEAQGLLLSGGDEKFAGETDLGLLYRLNHSKNSFPEFSLSPIAILPTGKGMSVLDYSLRANATSTIRGTSDKPKTQIHFNYQIVHNNDPQKQEREDGNSYALGISHLVLESTAIVVDGVIEEEQEKSKATYLIEIGVHHHLGKNYFFAASLGTGVGASVVDQQGLLAFEKQFY